MNAEFFEALSMLEAERGLPAEYLLEKIKNAIVIAVKKDYDVEDENVSVEIDPATGKFNVSLLKQVVDEVEDTRTQISLEAAQAKRKTYKLGDMFQITLKTKDFGRIAAQTAKHVIRQGLKEAERSQMYAEMQSKAHEIVSAVVTNVDPQRGIVTLELGKGGVATLPRNEQVPGETLTEGQHLQVYVVDVVESERGPRMMISRTHPGLVKRMFEMEVPEIFDGIVDEHRVKCQNGARTEVFSLRSRAALLLDNEAAPMELRLPSLRLLERMYLMPLELHAVGGDRRPVEGVLTVEKGVSCFEALQTFSERSLNCTPYPDKSGGVHFESYVPKTVKPDRVTAREVIF